MMSQRGSPSKHMRAYMYMYSLQSASSDICLIVINHAKAGIVRREVINRLRHRLNVDTFSFSRRDNDLLPVTVIQFQSTDVIKQLQ